MSVAILVQPASTWRPYVPPVPKPGNMARRAEPERDWEDLAADEDWTGAILGFLRKNWRGKHLLWHVIDAVVAESRPEARCLVRRATREALSAMMELIRQRRVMRHRRRWVAALELPAELQPSGSEISCTVSESGQSAKRRQHLG